MKDEEKNKLYRDAMVFWGMRKQSRMLQEECGELIVAVSHFLRKPHDVEMVDNLAEELADVHVMLEQIIVMVGKNRVEEIIDFKLDRVKEKLERYKREQKSGN